QIQYNDARDFERFGDLATAVDRYQAIVRLFRKEEADAAIVYLAAEGIERIGSQSDATLADFLESKLAEAQEAYDRARIKEAKKILESIIELYSSNQDVATLVARAEQMLESFRS
ncbi:MAG TPA: serine/threonine protein kinase, partial [Planctomycetaceae bacterium]|nr:serine/threonine protein kinase [Planctomycetaceae bacterium]